MNGGRSIEDLELDLMFIRAMENADFRSENRWYGIQITTMYRKMIASIMKLRQESPKPYIYVNLKRRIAYMMMDPREREMRIRRIKRLNRMRFHYKSLRIAKERALFMHSMEALNQCFPVVR